MASEGKLTVLLAGATGRTGVLAYAKLKKLPNVNVRALVRNATKAKSELGCNACDEGEGIYVGDITKPETLTGFTQGADVLVSTIGSSADCKYGFFDCTYRNGSYPKDINWIGLKTLTSVFAKAGGHQVVHMSTMSTTKPDNFLDKLGNHGWVTFYSLNYEAYLMATGLNFTIVKPCGLGDGEGGTRELLVGHEDDINLAVNHMIQRADVARVLTAAVEVPQLAANLRFDLCTKAFSKPTVSPQQVFKLAMRPWDPRKSSTSPMPPVIV
eukprot:gnl/MRDRNA2_/MRDRNA2_69196_c0_seq1.p1 gnl/MRDRNA2_/MRDRNA2_69196_c0~~gnl/MRDRNA2_/MRDRNA2_69196_c0_seq1.p1  ORF type:complete len:310 (+),score=61.50 gnl/MRDRNA2_/MRDRNA2_69196_c0_seq1:124-930(+)